MNKTLLIFILLFSLNFATNDIELIISQSQNAYLIIFLVFMLSALVYMGGSIFSVPSWTARGKDMLYQGIFSLVLMASLPAIYAIFTSIFSALFLGNYTLPPNTSMFDLSENLLLWNYIYYFIHLIIVTIGNLFVLTFFGKTYSVPIANRVVPFDMTVLQSPLLYIVNTMVGILSVSIMINGFQLLFLNFVKYTIIPFLLPIGLLLRAFPTSMHAGNVLVGISIASFIIVPLVYAIDLQILPKIVEIPNDLKTNQNFKSYNSFALMGYFYNEDILKEVVVESTRCDIIKESKQFFGQGFVSADSISSLQSTGEDCNIDFFKTTELFLEPISTLSTYVGSGFIGVAMITKGVNTIKGVINAFKAKDLTTPTWFNILDKVATAGALFYIILFFYEILLGVTVSFIVLSAILPFFKFTIIIIFIREFTYNILGTQISLGQITRLL